MHGDRRWNLKVEAHPSPGSGFCQGFANWLTQMCKDRSTEHTKKDYTHYFNEIT